MHRVRLLLGLCLAACARPRSPVAPLAFAVVAEPLYVDAFAPVGGDGSHEHPFRSLGAALGVAAGRRLVLATGLYEGPFELPEGVELEGKGQVVLHAPEGVVVRASGRARLASLMVQGGESGLSAKGGGLELEAVSFSGQRRVAAELERVVLSCRRCIFHGTVSETTGLRVLGGSARLEGARFEGAFRRAIEVRDRARLEASGLRSEGPVTAVHVVGGEAEVLGARIAGGRGPAVFAARASLRVDDLQVHGHEYALQTGAGAEVFVTNLTSVRAERAGVALVGSRGTLVDALVLDSGSHGAIHLLDAKVRLERIVVVRPVGVGVLARGGELSARHVLVSGVLVEQDGQAEGGGDGVSVRDGVADLEELDLENLPGVGVVAAERARLAVRRLTCRRCRLGALTVETEAQAIARSLIAHQGGAAAVSALENGRLRVEGLEARSFGEGPLFADCARGANVVVQALVSDSVPRPFPCVRVRR